MQIKIEIDVKPEELRRFLGLPDVSGLQDDVVKFLRTKVGQANESFNPGEFLRGNLESLRQTPAWKRFMAKVEDAEEQAATQAPPEPSKPRARKKSPRKSGTRSKKA